MDAVSRFGERLVILAHGGYPDNAKTMEGVMRYGDYDVAAVLAHTYAGSMTGEHFPELPSVPVLDTMTELDTPVDALLIGVAPVGGGLDPRWRADIQTALARGCDVISGLHTQLSDDAELAELAVANDATIHELRKPPSDLPIAAGRAADVDATVVLTVGTDCSVGKMTTTMELVRAATDRGIDAGAVATGQTGIAITGRGIGIDRVPADFAAGAAEQLVIEAAESFELVIVEGQAAIVHPGFSPDTIALLHGATPDGLVLCHDATRESYRNFSSFSLPPVERYVEWYTSLAEPIKPTRVIGGSIDTSAVESDAAARDAMDDFSRRIDAPATDVIRYGADVLVDQLV